LLCTEKFTFEKFWGWSKILGIILTVGGGIIIVLLNFLRSTNNNYKNIWLGIISMVVNVMSVSLGIILQKKFFFLKKVEVNKIEDDKKKEVLKDTENAFKEHHDIEDNIHVINEEPIIEKIETKEKTYSPVFITFYSFFYSCFFYVLILIFYLFYDIGSFKITLLQFLPLSYSSFIASALGFALYSILNKIFSPLILSVSSTLQTFFTIIFSYIIYGDLILWTDYFGGGFIILGLFFVILANYLETKKTT
jgi:drug/metabolite transporter (DMT)-like permease